MTRRTRRWAPKQAVQLTPPGSACSIAIGKGLTDMEPGVITSLQMVVEDAAAAAEEELDSLFESAGAETRLANATVNRTGSIVIRTRAVGQDTTLAQIVRLVEDAQGSKAPMQRLADQVSSWFIPVVLALAAGGYERAFEAIVERYRKPLHRWCRTVLPEARAEDAVQTTFLHAVRGLRRGVGRGRCVLQAGAVRAQREEREHSGADRDDARAAGVQKRLARSREPFADRRDDERIGGVGAVDDRIRRPRRITDHAVAAQLAAHRRDTAGPQLCRGRLSAGEPAHRVARFDEPLGHRPADVPGSACHEDFHVQASK